jgi:hypothetical protein
MRQIVREVPVDRSSQQESQSLQAVIHSVVDKNDKLHSGTQNYSG